MKNKPRIWKLNLEASNQTNEVIQDLEKSLEEAEETISKLGEGA